MAYKVKTQSDAKLDLLEAAAFVFEKEQSRSSVRRWLRDIDKVVAELKKSPLAFARIPEEFEGAERLREVHRHSHRIIYWVNEKEKTINIVRFYHSSRKPLSSNQVKFD